MPARIRTCLWFDSDGEEAANFYASVIPGSGIENVYRPKPDGRALIVNFTIGGVPYQALNGGPHFKLSEAVSISVTTRDQEETDRVWHALLEGGGQESKCCWLTDRFGLSWQIVPEAVWRLLGDPDREAADRVMNEILQMQKIDIAKLEAAFRGET